LPNQNIGFVPVTQKLIENPNLIFGAGLPELLPKTSKHSSGIGKSTDFESK